MEKQWKQWQTLSFGVTKNTTAGDCNHEILKMLAPWKKSYDQPSSVQFSRSVMSDSLRPHRLQHARPPCPSPSPEVHSDWSPLSQWCYPAISSWVVPFSYCSQSFPESESFPMSLFFGSGWPKHWSFSFGIIPSNEYSGLISFRMDWLQSKGLSRVFSNTIVQKHQFFGVQLSSQSNSHIHTWPLEKP